MTKNLFRSAARSLRARSFYANLVGLALGVLVYLLLTRLGAAWIDNSYMSQENVNRRKAQIYTQFSNYVTAEGVNGRDAAAVARWTASHSDVTIFLFGSGREQQLYAGGRINEDGRSSYDPTVHGKLYPVRFADGLYQIAIADSSQNRMRQLNRMVSFGAACLCLLAVNAWYTGRLTRRIIALSKEAALVSAGDLERSVASDGNDELDALADSMDEMRRSVIARLGSEKKAWEANTELITAISHDIRTPMTSLIGYLGLLCEGGQPDSETGRQFAASAYGKAMELKDLTDQLFRYFLVYGKAELDLNMERFDAQILLGQLLAEAEFDPADAGLTMQYIAFADDCVLFVDALYLKRVMDNVVSNLKKYADPAQPVVAVSELKDGMLSLTISNHVAAGGARKESTKIGLRTCEKILSSMGGSFETRADAEHFAVELCLPTEEAE